MRCKRSLDLEISRSSVDTIEQSGEVAANKKHRISFDNVVIVQTCKNRLYWCYDGVEMPLKESVLGIDANIHFIRKRVLWG